MRFKFNSNELEANIGHNFCSFNTGDHKNPAIFTGSTETTAKIECYDIFQVIMEKKKE